jgi:hypothetical protein
VVGAVRREQQDALRDDSRTGFPLLIRDASGTYVRAERTAGRRFRADYLFSYQPTPGHGAVRRLRRHAATMASARPGGQPLDRDERRVLPQGELPVPVVGTRDGV